MIVVVYDKAGTELVRIEAPISRILIDTDIPSLKKNRLAKGVK